MDDIYCFWCGAETWESFVESDGKTYYWCQYHEQEVLDELERYCSFE